MADKNIPHPNALAEAKLYKDRLAIALKAAKICVFEVDVTNQLYTFFENAEDIFGVSDEVILKDVQPFSKLSPEEYQKAASEYFSHPDDFEVIDQAFQSIFQGKGTTYEARMRAGGSNYIWCKLDVQPVIEENGTFKMIGVITDISASKSRRDSLEEEIKHDTFTGLYNKKFTLDQIRRILSRHPEQKHALIMTDIDNFKAFNDTYGHAEGDKIIKAVAETMKNTFRSTDVIGRFGGDEFVLFIRNFSNLDWLKNRLSHLIKGEACGYPWTVSIGIALVPQDADSLETLFKKADDALYQSKIRKGHYTFYADPPRFP